MNNEHIFNKDYLKKKAVRDGFYDNMAMRMNRDKVPMLVDVEVELDHLKEQFLMKGLQTNHLDVLEWGSGYGTKYLTDLLHEARYTFEWDSVEADLRWFVEVNKLELLPTSNIRLHLFEEPILRIDDRRKLNALPMKDYIEFPRKCLNKKFDIIYVDGTKRTNCLREATLLLKEGGFVLLHDAQRETYQKTMNEYYNGEFLCPKLWKGVPKKIWDMT